MLTPTISMVLLSLAFLSPTFAQSTNTSQPWTSWTSTGLNDYEAIQQTLNLDPIATDTKDWTLLPQIWTTNATASYDPTAPPLSGITAIQSFLEVAVNGTTSQHLLGTRLVNISADATSANVTTYAQATLWADPLVTATQVVMIYGFYNDQLVKTGDGWRLSNRVFRLMGGGRVGNTTVG